MSGGVERVREFGRMLEIEPCISRFIYPDAYSPVSTPRPNILPPLEKCPGANRDRSNEGAIRRNGVTYAKAKTYKRPSLTTENKRPHSGRLRMNGSKHSQRVCIPQESCGLS